MNLVNELEKILKILVERLYIDSKYSRLINGEISSEEYLYFLAQTYHYVINTSKTLLTVAQQLQRHPHLDYQVVRQRFLAHANEEKGHELWVLNDIQALGYNPQIVKDIVPNPAVVAYNAYSYFVATSHHSIGILGEAYILEGLSEKLGNIVFQNLRKNSKIANIEKAISFIESHAEADIQHMESLRNLLEKVTDESDKYAIRICADVVAQQYAHLLHY